MAETASGTRDVTRRIVDETAKCGISLVASLPDGWITDLISGYAADRFGLQAPVWALVVLALAGSAATLGAIAYGILLITRK